MDALPGETVGAALARTHEAAARWAVLEAFGRVRRRLHAAPAPGALRATDGPWLERVLREAEAHLAAGGVDGTARRSSGSGASRRPRRRRP